MTIQKNINRFLNFGTDNLGANCENIRKFMYFHVYIYQHCKTFESEVVEEYNQIEL